MSNWWSKSDLKPEPGDLIEIFRGVYSHWAVYVCAGYVVHVTLPPGGEVSGAVSNTLMSVPTKKAMVKFEKLQEVVGDNQWRINNSLDENSKPRSPHIIVKVALMEVGKMMEYNFIINNCEHFATKMRYGKAVSIQVMKAALAPVYVPILIILSWRKAATAAAEHFRRLQTDRQTFSSTSPRI